MNQNISEIYPNQNILIGTYIVVTIYSISVIFSILICSIIIYLTYITPNLHTPINLLLSNTCICTLVFSGISATNVFFFYIDGIKTDWSCRILGYLIYVSISLVMYSLVIQALSRLFWTVLYKYRCLLTMKCHFYLIVIQILSSILFPLSTLITKNITYRPFKLCFVPLEYKIHVLYLTTIVYCIPIIIIITLYIIIYYYTTISSLHTRRLVHGKERDRILARNILVLLSIFLFGGIPLVIYNILSNTNKLLPTGFYLFSITTPAIAIIFEKIAIIILNKELQKVLKQRLIGCYNNLKLSTDHVLPYSSSKNVNKIMIRTISKTIPHTAELKT